MTVVDRWRRRLVAAAACLQVVLVLWLTTFFLFVVPGTAPPFVEPALQQAPWFLTASVAISGLVVIAWLLVRREPRHGLIPVLVISALAVITQWVMQSWVLMSDRYGWPGGALAQWSTNIIWIGGIAGFLLFLLRFPTGRPLSTNWRRYEICIGAQLSVLAAYLAFVPKVPGTPPDYPPNPLGLPALQDWVSAFWVLFALLGVDAAAGLVALALRFHTGNQVERQQLRWVAAASCVLLVGALIGGRTAPLTVALVLFVAAIGVAVLRYRLWDLGLVLRRTLLYAMLTAVLLAGYVALVIALREVITVDLVPELLVTAVIAILALPLREFLQRAIDKMLFGDRRDPYAVVRAIGRRLEQAEAALPSVLAELSESLRLSGSEITLPDGSVVAAYGSMTTVGIRIHLHHFGRRVGDLVAAHRNPNEPFSGAEVRLLSDVAGHLGVAVQSVLLDEAVHRSQDRLTEIREAERDRLRRDLHDEMGPLLGAASLRVQAARNLLATSEPPLERVNLVLAAVAIDVDRAQAEAQRIVSDLRPGSLDDRGLLGALREHTDVWAGRLRLRLDLPIELPRLDPRVEAAAYRIALEGLRNAERHSGGTTATLRVGISDGQLDVIVDDDGHGLTVPSPTGVGLGSMRERARLVGGSVRLESAECGGLRVRGRLPLAATK